MEDEQQDVQFRIRFPLYCASQLYNFAICKVYLIHYSLCSAAFNQCCLWHRLV